MNEYITGVPKLIDAVSLGDMMKHPIWLTVFNVHGPNDDEIYQVPVINSTDITDDLRDPFILMKIKGTDYYLSAQFYHPSLMVHKFYAWDEHQRVENMPMPIVLIAVPSINGELNVEFTTVGTELDYAIKSVLT